MNEDTLNNDLDEDADLDTADDGSELPEGGDAAAGGKTDDVAGEAAEDAKIVVRDAKGRFAAKDGEIAEGDEGDEGDGAGEAGSEAGSSGAEELETAQKHVPYSRFREVVERRKAAEARAAELEELAKKAAGKPDDEAEAEQQLNALYEQVEEARADGDTKAAAALQRQIDAMNADRLRAQSVMAARRESVAAAQVDQYNHLLGVLEAKVPELNPDAAEFDARLVSEIQFQVEAHEKMGLSAPDALRRAASLLLKNDPFDGGAAKPAAKAPVAPLRKKVDVEKNAAAAARTPPRGDRSEAVQTAKIDVAKLTDEEFDALPESKLRELGGDYLT